MIQNQPRAQSNNSVLNRDEITLSEGDIKTLSDNRYQIDNSVQTKKAKDAKQLIPIQIIKTKLNILKLVKGYIGKYTLNLLIPECIHHLCYSYYSAIFNKTNLFSLEDQKDILRNISLTHKQCRLYHGVLKKILLIQTEQINNNYLYWTALLLYFVGDVNDIEILWNAKNIDFDRFGHFDDLYLVGAGIDITIRHCDGNNLNVISDYLRKHKKAGVFKKTVDSINTLQSYIDGNTQ